MALDLPLHVETRGRGTDHGDTFLLLHGFGASSFTWRGWSPALEARGPVVLVDLSGFGAAPKPRKGLYGPVDQAELVYRLVLERDLRNLTLVGHSLGGGIALLTALRLLDEGGARLRRLVVVSGAAYLQPMPPFVAYARHRRLALLLLRLLSPRFVARRFLKSCVYDPSAVTREQVAGYAEPLRGRRAHVALVDAARQIVPPDLDRYTVRYPEIDVPTLLLWGRHDRVVPLRYGHRLADALPRARLVVLEACGHVPPEERPAASLAAVEEFLDAGPPGGAGASGER